jgi:hypothetical protein
MLNPREGRPEARSFHQQGKAFRANRGCDVTRRNGLHAESLPELKTAAIRVDAVEVRKW